MEPCVLILISVPRTTTAAIDSNPGPGFNAAMRHPRHDSDDPPRERYRAAAGPVATIGQLLREPRGRWAWVYCRNPACGHYRAMPLAPFAIRWGMDASTDIIRERLRCAACGRLGVTMSLSRAAFPAPTATSGSLNAGR